MADRGPVRDVDARGTLALGRLGDCWCGRGRILELGEARHEHRGEGACHPAAADERLTPGRERARVAMSAFAAAEPVLDYIAGVTPAVSSRSIQTLGMSRAYVIVAVGVLLDEVEYCSARIIGRE